MFRAPTMRRALGVTFALAAGLSAATGAFGPGSGKAAAGEGPADPLKSVMWSDMREKFLGSDTYVFDDRVKVSVPSVVENQAQVPVTVDARALPGVQKLVVFADLNPIQHVLTLRPVEASAFIAFRMKVEQGTPVRAAALTSDGVWHVGGVYLDAAGGGCSAPPVALKTADWSETVGQTQGRVWRQVDGSARVGLRMRHPMDTGLSRDNTPAFFMEQLDIRSQSGAPLAGLDLYEPVSEDPTLTFEVRLPLGDASLEVTGRDNNGSTYRSSIPASWRQSALTPSGAAPADRR